MKNADFRSDDELVGAGGRRPFDRLPSENLHTFGSMSPADILAARSSAASDG
jgi:hypothetical protein